MKQFRPADSFVRVAAAVPRVSIADVAHNIEAIRKLYKEACDAHVSLVTFPELCITGYSLGDIVRQQSLLQQAVDGLCTLATETQGTSTAMVVGLPYAHGDNLYNCAAVLANGQIMGIVTKSNLPNYAEFYEQRWYRSFQGTTTTHIQGNDIPFGQSLLFQIDHILFGVEICEDVWVSDRPSRKLVQAGALVIVNPSASPELVGKAGYRRELVLMTSATERCAYVYASADWTESTTDIVMSGHCIIAENGRILQERQPFAHDNRLLITDVDTDHLRHDRLQDTTVSSLHDATVIDCNLQRTQTNVQRVTPRSYFLPEQETEQQRTDRLSSIVAIQAHGLARRLLASNAACVVLGLSGGLDSTLALFVALRATHIIGKDPSGFIHTLTMPGPASSTATQHNAISLAHHLGVTSVTLPIRDMVVAEQGVLQHTNTTDIAYENIQARARTALLFNYANTRGGLVVGTGDLSELALGWCTYGGDHLSSYNPNASIPKTLVRDLVRFCSEQPDYIAAKPILDKIINTVISPELIAHKKGEISQSTEELIGPYELHDFFLYHVLRFGDTPPKIAYLAGMAFRGTYTQSQIKQWLTLFYDRFAKNQFKRSALPDGPKIGSVAISPRGDWRMPSDMTATAWQ